MPDSPVVPLLRRTFWGALIATVVIAATVVGVALAQLFAQRAAQESREVVRKARRAQLLALNRETGVRGFLLSGDSASLAPDFAAREPLRATLDSLVLRTVENPPQHRRAIAFAAAIARWDSAFATPAVEEKARLGANADVTRFGEGELAGKLLFDDIRIHFEELAAEEESQYQDLTARSARLQILNVGVAAAGLALLAALHRTLRRRVLTQAAGLVQRQQQLEEQAVELEEQAAELEEQATELEAQTEELQGTVKELRRKNEELDAFSASVAHDLRSPLRSIDGFSHLLLTDYSDRLDADGAAALRRIRANSQRMGDLIDGLLSLARVSGAELRFEPVDISGVGDAICRDLHRGLEPDRSIECVVQRGLTAHADARLMRSALRNLLENAFKFTRGVAAARVELGALVVDGERAFFVADNGIGFDMKYADTLFAPFERLHDDPRFEGTGVGLATVRRIVERHGGRLWADAEPGRGATFYFTLAS
ncbi:MAG TPA: ATP-binding protein [Gemmatimonadaceae bacterium]|jgi:signal transduction histidine kinase|nr:ATP-binding protein [Gemmatimonadaceae bacterium]